MAFSNQLLLVSVRIPYAIGGVSTVLPLKGGVDWSFDFKFQLEGQMSNPTEGIIVTLGSTGFRESGLDLNDWNQENKSEGVEYFLKKVFLIVHVQRIVYLLQSFRK